MQRKNLLSFVAVTLIAVIALLSFGFEETTRAADETTKYVFEDAATTHSHVRTDSGLEDYDELVYCLEIMKRGPNLNVDYSRTLLSDFSNYDSAAKSKLMVLLMDRSGIVDVLDELVNNNVPYANKFKLAYWNNGASNYVFQHLVWIIVSEDDFLNNRKDEYGYTGIEKGMSGRADYSYTNDDSIWKTIYEPLLNYIDSKAGNYPVGKGPGQYDASFYSPEGGADVQLLLGRGFVNPTPTPTENVEPSVTPTTEPAVTAGPTVTPTTEPAAQPTTSTAPSATPTEEPAATTAPTVTPTTEPAAQPTTAPTATPTEAPAATPTEAATVEPTTAPTATPTEAPKATPTEAPEATPAISKDGTDTATPTPTEEVKVTATPAPSTPDTNGSTSDNDDAESGVKPTNAPAITPSAAFNTGDDDTPSAEAPEKTDTIGTSSTENDETEAAATPTAAPTATATPTDKPAKAESKIVQTGESYSESVVIAAFALLAAGTLLIIRAKKYKEN